MDKQNEGIKDPAVKVIPYDMGGYLSLCLLLYTHMKNSQVKISHLCLTKVQIGIKV